MDLTQESAELLRAEAAGYAAAALANIKHEFPAAMQHTMTAPGDFPYRPRARTPVFYGSFDWHSSVQMHWTLLRLLRTVPDAVPGTEIRLRAQRPVHPGGDGRRGRVHRRRRTPEPSARRAGAGRSPSSTRRHLGHPDGRKWADAMAPLAEALAGASSAGCPGRPTRSATARSRAARSGCPLAWPFAEARAGAGDPALRDAIVARALAWFSADSMYPADWEPSGDDCCLPR